MIAATATTELWTDWLTAEAARPFLGGIAAKSVLALFRVGTKTLDGRRVRLESQPIGSRLFTTERWIREHLAAVREADRAAEATAGSAPTAPAESPDRQAERFRREQEQAAAMFTRKTTKRRPR